MNRKKIAQIILIVLIVCTTNSTIVHSRQNGKARLDFLSMNITPKVAAPNDTVNVVVVYKLHGIVDSDIDVTERKVLRFDGHEIALLEKNQVQRTNGRWVIETTFLIPASVTMGEYEILQVVFSDSFSRSFKGSFVVQPTDKSLGKELEEAAAHTQKLKEELEAEMRKDVVEIEKNRLTEEKGKEREKKEIVAKKETALDEKNGKAVQTEIVEPSAQQKKQKPEVIAVIQKRPLNKVKKRGMPSSELVVSHDDLFDKLNINEGVRIQNAKKKKDGEREKEVLTIAQVKPQQEKTGAEQGENIPLQGEDETEKTVEKQVLLSEQEIDDMWAKAEVPVSVGIQVEKKEEKQAENIAEVDQPGSEGNEILAKDKLELEPKQSAQLKPESATIDQQEIYVEEKKPTQDQYEVAPLAKERSPLPAQLPDLNQPAFEEEEERDVETLWLHNRDKRDPRISKLAKREQLKNGELGPWMVAIPLGSFSMGGERYNEKPVHSVNIDKEFSIMIHEVTIDMYQRYRKSVYGDEANDTQPWAKYFPVANISWREAAGFAVWLSENTGHTYRLPTEAEWEYVAKYCTKKPQSSSPLFFQNMNSVPEDQENVDQQMEVVFNSSRDLCKFYGLRGNVWEWTEDCWSERYSEEHTTQEAYSYPNCGNRVVRGGSYLEEKQRQTPTARMGIDQKARVPYIGFRLVREGPF